MILLSRAEETALLAILGLGENAYGVSILEYIREKTRIEWSLSQAYSPKPAIPCRDKKGVSHT
jgi:hypothetical protein